MSDIKMSEYGNNRLVKFVTDTCIVEITSVKSPREEKEVAELVKHRFNSYDANQERIKELERLADNLLWRCVESDSDISDSDAWHELERALKHDL